ncbi:hypothetical protein MP228_012608 [Amoeboaphelidium protococcarum]|nr:hypothetical protein MP228_012608 [Amoeboaphelidium protococcarum]
MAKVIGNEAVKKLLKGKVISDVIKQESDLSPLGVSYKQTKVYFGNELSIHDTQQEPSINLHALGASAERYTLIMVDPDAPAHEHPTFAQFRHWLVINITAGQVETGQEITPYMGPAPPAKTGLHRYVFLLYQQDDELMSDEVEATIRDRPKFNAEHFASTHSLSLAAANYFVAQNQSEE